MNKDMLDEIEEMKKMWIVPTKITFKERFKLLFVPMRKVSQFHRGDITIVTYYKEMDGVFYIIKEKIKYC